MDASGSPAEDPGGGAWADVEPVRFACSAANTDAIAAPDGLRRLSAVQYDNTITDLTALLLGDGIEARTLVTLAGMGRVPADRRASVASDPAGGLRRLDQVVDQVYVEETFHLSRELSLLLTGPDRLGRVVGPCAVDDDASNDEACLLAFIERFGSRALRRPLDDGDVQFHRAVYGSEARSDPAAYADLITVLLSAPELLYFVEHGEQPVQGVPERYALSAHELASRLSYHYWQTLPDDALWEAAQDGSLLQPEVLQAQVARLVDDPRTRQTLRELFADMLALDELPQLDALSSDARMVAFAGDDLPGPELREQVIDDALDMLSHYTFDDPAGAHALLTSQRSFARGQALSQIYGVDTWDGVSQPPTLPDGQRPGLLTRAWLLVSGTPDTRPIRRGALVRRRILCDELAPPPLAVTPESVAPQPQQSTRDAVAALTEQPGTACASCHATQINPLGFALEGFDALGRARELEARLRADGAHVAELPIDTTTTPHIVPDDPRQVSGPRELAERVLESGKLEACLARHYFRFAFGRREDLQRDGCVLERLRQRLVESGRIRDMIAEVGLTVAMTQRSFGALP